MKINIIAVLTLLLSLLCISNVKAEKLYVYRMDARPPEQVFNQGFLSLGNNNNLYLHVEGETCFSGTRDSTFISTSDSQQFAITWGAVGIPAGGTFYVYRILAGGHFYNAYNSLINAYRRTNNILYYNTANNFREQREWVSSQNIPSNQIMVASQYISRGMNQEPELIEEFHNPLFQDQDLYPSSENYMWNFDEDDDASSSICSSTCSEDSSKKSRDIKNSKIDYDLIHWFSCKRKIMLFMD